MIILGSLNIICGVIVLLTHISKQFDYVTHATENLIVILIGVVLLCTGFLLLGINSIIKSFEERNIQKGNSKFINIKDTSWKCLNCNSTMPQKSLYCSICGYKKGEKPSIVNIEEDDNDDDIHFCIECHETMSKKEQFCPACGTKQF